MSSTGFETVLGDICLFRRGVSYRGDDIADSSTDGIPMINMKSFSKNGEYRTEGIKFFSGDFRSKNLIQSDEVILANTDLTQTGDILGAAVMLPPQYNGQHVISSHHTTILTVTDERVMPHFLRLLLNTEKVRMEIRKFRRGATVKSISLNDIKKIGLKIPSIDRQSQLVGLHQKVSRICELSCKYDKLKDKVIESIFLEIFGDVAINDKMWRVDSLGAHMELINGRAYSKNELLGHGTPIIRIQNLKGGQKWYYSDLELREEKYCDKGDLLFAWSATFGPFIWEGERSIYHYHIWKIKLKDTINKTFAYWLLNLLTNSIKNQSHGASMLHYGKAKMENLEIPIPPMDLQMEFVRLINKVNDLQSRSRTSRVAELNKIISQEVAE